MTAVGTPVTRVDGPAKVTGAARYTAEVQLPGMTHLAVVGATIARGRVIAVDTDAARAAEGVLAVLTDEDLPRIAADPHLLPSLVGGAAPGESFFPMQDDVVHYAGQPVALVVAEQHEQAQHAASLVRVSYRPDPPLTSIDRGREQAFEAERLIGGLLPGRKLDCRALKLHAGLDVGRHEPRSQRRVVFRIADRRMRRRTGAAAR